MLKTELALRKISQKRAAEAIDATPSEMSLWCSGDRPIPVPRAMMLHKAFQIPMVAMVPDFCAELDAIEQQEVEVMTPPADTTPHKEENEQASQTPEE